MGEAAHGEVEVGSNVEVAMRSTGIVSEIRVVVSVFENIFV